MENELVLTCGHFNELDTHVLYSLLQLRAEVFIVEQNCAYQDVDGMDQQALHVTGHLHNAGQQPMLVCYTRLLPAGSKYENASIGRVITRKTVRGDGYGKILMQRSIACCREHWPGEAITISAQQYLEKFYTELGFTTESEPYDEDGIPHIGMKLNS